MARKVYLTLLMFVFLISLASAFLGTFRQGECVEIRTILNTTSANISSISYPNSSIAITEQVMTQNGRTFNYSFCDTSTIGTYVYDYYDAEGNVYVNDFDINHLGRENTEQKTWIYIIILIFSVFVFLGLLWIGLALPSKNKSDEYTGYVIAIRNIKYLKHVLLGFAYISLLWIVYFSWMLVYTFLDFQFLNNIFRFMFTFLAILTLPLFILYLFITIANLIHDSKVKDALLRGLSIR